MLRTHTCGQIRVDDEGEIVTLCGWNHSIRDHGDIIFGDMRDRYGLTQVVFDPSESREAHKIAESLKREDVIRVTGMVRKRDKSTINDKISTGQVEVIVKSVDVLNRSKTPPMEIDERVHANDEIRMSYRFIDLRKPDMQMHFAFRHNAAQAVRKYFSENGFLEIETPILVKSTPEGARDYIVPSRISPGKFYALPQSPQLYKQMLMVSGFDRYFQLARCFRDEDLRADRQPEHTQIDMEMSFADSEDIFRIIEGLIKEIVKTTLNKNVPAPFLSENIKALPIPIAPIESSLSASNRTLASMVSGMILFLNLCAIMQWETLLMKESSNPYFLRIAFAIFAPS